MSSIKYYYINHQQQFFLSWPCHHWEWPILTIFQLFRIKKENIKVIKKKEDCGIPNLIFFRVNKLSLNIFFLVFDQKNFHFPSFFAPFMKPEILEFLQCHQFFSIFWRTKTEQKYELSFFLFNVLDMMYFQLTKIKRDRDTNFFVIERRALGPFVESYYTPLNLIDVCWHKRK